MENLKFQDSRFPVKPTILFSQQIDGYSTISQNQELMFDSMSLPVILMNNRGAIVFCNSFFYRTTGYSFHDLLGKRAEHLCSLLEFQPPISAITGQQSVTCNISIRTKYGDIKQFKMMADPLRGSSEKEGWHVWTFLPQEQAPKSLPAIPGQFSNNFEYVNYLLRTQYVSHLSMFGASVELLVKACNVEHAGIIIFKDDKLEFCTRYDNGQFQRIFDEIRLRQLLHFAQNSPTVSGLLSESFPQFFGPILPCLLTFASTNVKSSDGRTGLLWIGDIKERIINENEKQLLELFAHLLSKISIRHQGPEHEIKQLDEATVHAVFWGLAHEVRNPLNGIVALSEAMNIDLSSNIEYARYFSLIFSQSDRITNLVQELVRYSSPVVLSELSIDDLHLLCSNAIEQWKKNRPSEELFVKILKCEDLQSEMFLDREQFSHALIELLNNAVNHNVICSEIIVSLEVLSSNSFLSIKVVDKGLGVPNDLLSFVFDPFFTTKKKSFGLGLSIAKRIVEKHNGNIQIYNNKYFTGCTVDIQIPCNVFAIDK